MSVAGSTDRQPRLGDGGSTPQGPSQRNRSPVSRNGQPTTNLSPSMLASSDLQARIRTVYDPVPAYLIGPNGARKTGIIVRASKKGKLAQRPQNHGQPDRLAFVHASGEPPARLACLLAARGLQRHCRSSSFAPTFTTSGASNDSPLRSLIASGTKIWLDSIDPELVAKNRALGATGATSNPIIVSDLIKTGRFDRDMEQLIEQKLSDEQIAWRLTDKLVSEAQAVFRPVWEQTHGNDGYVSFELDPLLEDPQLGPPHAERVARYIELGKNWSQGHVNRMMKVPATPAGIDALEDTGRRRHHAQRHADLHAAAIPRGPRCDLARRPALRRPAASSRASTASSCRASTSTPRSTCRSCRPAAQGMVGIVGAKRIWAENREFWRDKKLPLDQEMVFASTGTKKPSDPPWKYVAAFAGSDIETNPPATNDAIETERPDVPPPGRQAAPGRACWPRSTAR